eukprot:jgi/Galph1/3577/GphlegSOOS_G2196.1
MSKNSNTLGEITPSIYSEEYKDSEHKETRNPMAATENAEKLLKDKAFKANGLGATLGFLSTGYQFAVISLLNIVWQKEYPVAYTSSVETRLNNAILYGVLIGQLGVGLASDLIGRKAGLLFTSSVIVISSILCAASFGKDNSSNGMFWMLTIFQGLLGVGGERIGLLTICIETIGNNLPTVVQIILLKIFGTEANQMEPVWRLSFGLGAVPTIIVFFFRLRMRDSSMYVNARKEKVIRKRFYLALIKRYWLWIFATSFVWFIIDAVNYSLGTFGSLITEKVTGSGIMRVAYYQLINFSLIPFSYAAAYLVDIIGRKKLILLGFASTGGLLFLIGGLYPILESHPAAYLVLNAFQGGFQRFVYLAAYMLPAEIFPTMARATCLGFCLAVGFAGAIVGIQFFLPIAESFSTISKGFRVDFLVAGGLNVLGIIVALLFLPEPAKLPLEELENKFDELLREQTQAAGY